MTRTTVVALIGLLTSSLAACSDVNAMSAKQLEDQYGLSGASAETVMTPDGPVKGMLVPITLANGRAGHLFIPQRQTNDVQAVYLQDEQGLHPVQLKDETTRAEIVSAPGIVERRTAPASSSTRSWQKDVLIVGGSAGAGAAIGALAGGKKGAGVGAATGGVGGLIYDLATRNKDKK